MKNLVYLAAIVGLGVFTFACGGKTETKENETEQVSTTVNSNANNSVNPPITKQNDGDADDIRANNSLPNNSNLQTKKDADDFRNENSNQRKIDRDDKNVNRATNSRRDSDVDGKRDDDSDEYETKLK